MYLLLKNLFLGLKIIKVVRESLMLMFRSAMFLKNLAGDGFTIVIPLLINSISFQVKEFISSPENIE
jgi:hypothetical protein